MLCTCQPPTLQTSTQQLHTYCHTHRITRQHETIQHPPHTCTHAWCLHHYISCVTCSSNTLNLVCLLHNLHGPVLVCIAIYKPSSEIAPQNTYMTTSSNHVHTHTISVCKNHCIMQVSHSSSTHTTTRDRCSTNTQRHPHWHACKNLHLCWGPDLNSRINTALHMWVCNHINLYTTNILVIQLKTHTHT